MNKEIKDILNMRRKLVVLEYANLCGSVSETCKEFNVPGSFFYDWKKAFD